MSQVNLAAWIEQDEPDIDYEFHSYACWWSIGIQLDWNFDDLVYLVVDEQGHLEDYL